MNHVGITKKAKTQNHGQMRAASNSREWCRIDIGGMELMYLLHKLSVLPDKLVWGVYKYPYLQTPDLNMLNKLWLVFGWYVIEKSQETKPSARN